MRTRWIGASLGSLVVVAGMLVPSANAATATPPITPTPPSRAAATSQSHFLTGRRAGTPLSNAIRFLNASKSRYGLTPADISTARVTNKYTDSDTGTTHIYFQQMYRHIPVANSILSVNVARDGSIINVGNRFVRGIAIKAPPLQVTKTAGAAMGAAARALHLGSPGPLKQVAAAGGATRRSRLLAPAISTRPIDASLVWQPMKTGRVALAWNGQLVPRSGAHWWNVSVDAVTGSVAAVDDWVAHDVAGDGTYRAFAPPSQGPDPSNPVDSRTLFPSLADPTGSPYGWLDTNGVAGADSTVTFGNNADAGVDAVAPDGIDPGTEAPAASGLVFDSPWNPLLPVAQSTNAAVTNLFVWGNYVHDITSHYGFTEAAGNFQNLNYTGQGVGGDAVSMQDLDFSGTNNANFATPPDGTSGRMQMFRTTNGSSSTVTINSPVAIQGTINSLPSSNDAANVTIDNLPVVLVNDGNSITSDACESMPAGSLTGDIALVDRGTCGFLVKFQNVYAAGASAVILVNNVASSIFRMNLTGAGAIPPLPGVMISQADGATLKDALGAGVNASVDIVTQPDRDTSFDPTVVAHEYMHGVSARLTGGAANTGCLLNAETPSEGWSDFLALALTQQPGDKATTPRGEGSWSFFSPGGIRPTPYSTDQAVDPATYDRIKSFGEVHDVGYVWASMLWDMYWKLVAQHGYDANLNGPTTSSGNRLALQLVIDALKLQPCSPGFVDSRDAILLADQNLTGGANQCLIWSAFAGRGLGVNASEGTTDSTTDGSEDYEMPASCHTDRPAISGGGNFSCALDKSGKTSCFGTDISGDTLAPDGVFAGVSVALDHSCGVNEADQSVACWGVNTSGESSPPTGRFTQVSSGAHHSCALSPAGSVTCWGDSSHGEAVVPSGRFTQVSAGDAYTCALTSTASLACWGSSTFGRTSPPSGTFTDVAAGITHACAVATNGTLSCWGDNTGGAATPPSGTYTSVSAGLNFSCGVKSDASLACWGDNTYGKATPPAGSFTSVAAGYNHACGVKTDGYLACWGFSQDGRSGAVPTIGDLPGSPVDVAYDQSVVTGIPAPTVAVSSGDLPPGLTLDGATGGISGTPTTAGEYTGELTATNLFGSVIKAFSIVVTTPLTVTAPTVSRVVGEPNGALAADYQGFVTGESEADLTTAAACSTTRTATSPPGSYDISCSGVVASPKYVISYVNPGHLTVSKASTTTSASWSAGTASAHVAVVSPGSGSPTGTVTFSVGGQSVGTGQVNASGDAQASVPLPVGSSTVLATYAGDASYEGSNGSTGSIAVTTPLTVTSPSVARVVGQATGALPPQYSGFIGGDNASVLTTGASCVSSRTPLSAPGNYVVTCSGVVAPAKYAVTYANTGKVTVSRASTSTVASLAGGNANAHVAVLAPGAGTPTGTVTFSIGGQPVGTGQVNGSGDASAVISLPAGAVTVQATYAGDSSFAGSNGSIGKTDPTISAAVSGSANGAGWRNVSPIVSFTCTPGSAALVGACPTPITVGQGKAQQVTGSVAATDGGAASVTVTGLNVDLTAPTVTVKGVTSGAKFAGPLTSAITCASTDALSGPAAPCTVAVTKLTGAKTPFWVTTWRYTARGADAAGNTRTVTGTYSTGSIFVAGAAPGLFGSSRVKPGSLVTLKVAIPATKAPRLYVPVKAGATRTAVPTTPSVLLTRAKDGTWVTQIRITAAQAKLSRYWVVGVKLVGETKVRTLLLDTR